MVPRACFGYASDPGGRGYQDDRCAAFSTRLWDGRRATVAAVLDGHHGHQLADMMAEQLPYAFKAAMDERRNVPEGLVSHAVPPPPPLPLALAATSPSLFSFIKPWADGAVSLNSVPQACPSLFPFQPPPTPKNILN